MGIGGGVHADAAEVAEPAQSGVILLTVRDAGPRESQKRVIAVPQPQRVAPADDAVVLVRVHG